MISTAPSPSLETSLDNDDNTVRLSKRVADERPCSRREAELYIEGGFVSVDGQLVEEVGARVAPHQKVTVAEDATLLEIVPVTILLHKPAGATQPLHLLNGDTLTRSVPGQRFLKRHITGQQELLALDAKVSGLAVFTQDFRVNRKLTDEAAKIEQEIIVEVTGQIIEGGLQQLNQINGKVSWQNETRLRFAIKNAKPGLIEKLCKEVGLKVVAMKRIRIGRISMASLPSGEWRYLQNYERF
ncbi:RNA-binding protein [Pseudoduganella sp. FT25W]|uniref:Dual-specificity RNA pseudouridine synthase RluF n=1 Tax=Duganella alba TaxID=2666081 RepID=A0A6L5QEM2_9BURK|nr:RNA pseudouridine synthase [Duganella alba]MRX07571.1 RNA-binding protein [Duganella alba]MRX15956.1 RNA-binding protein [Duganella alba]